MSQNHQDQEVFHNFLPHTVADRQAMLKTMGMSSEGDLFADVAESLKQNVTIDSLPEYGLSELELQETLKTFAGENRATGMACFLGGGAYPRFIPPAVNTIASRSEFYTAYTPYQPEISQGTLQYTYEFQTMICELTGMDAANASVYDGGVAMAEAALMALRVHKKRKTIAVLRTVHPDYRQIIETYLGQFEDVRLVEVASPETLADTLKSQNIDSSDVAGVLVQNPNYLGQLDELESVQTFCKESEALYVVSADPVSLGVLTPPGEYGADIVVGDIQPLGNLLSYGGPYGGYMACLSKYVRQLPGRLVGRTFDKNNTQCYTLTLQTREQHIRRERATSNICTNQALNILKATVYMTVMGSYGLQHVAETSVQRAHYLFEQLTQLSGVTPVFGDGYFFSEFAIKLPVPVAEFLSRLESVGILGGIPLEGSYPEFENSLLVSCTELTTPQDIDNYLQVAKAIIEGGEAPIETQARQNGSSILTGLNLTAGRKTPTGTIQPSASAKTVEACK